MHTVTTEVSAERELQIQSRIDEILRVERFVEELNALCGFKDDVFANIMVAVTEAVNNGIVHGNKQVVAKSVTLRSKMLNPFLLSITVQDEGPGFDYHHMPDPTDPLNLLQERGRGVFVMSHLADSIQYRGNGSEVEMRFNI
jgi:serine/threonine-protein kinase RsbW